LNSDLFLTLSGQKIYFYQQKDAYIYQIKSLSTDVEKYRQKKRNFKKQLFEEREIKEYLIGRYEKNIQFFRDKVN
jgi:hypothetical protein